MIKEKPHHQCCERESNFPVRQFLITVGSVTIRQDSQTHTAPYYCRLSDYYTTNYQLNKQTYRQCKVNARSSDYKTDNLTYTVRKEAFQMQWSTLKFGQYFIEFSLQSNTAGSRIFQTFEKLSEMQTKIKNIFCFKTQLAYIEDDDLAALCL